MNWGEQMAGNSELMDIIKKNVDNHHAKLSDSLYEKWLELHRTGRIENRESAFHLSAVIDLKTAIAEYLESSSLAVSWQNTSEEDQNGICSILLMDFLVELAHSFHGKFRTPWGLHNTLLVKKNNDKQYNHVPEYAARSKDTMCLDRSLMWQYITAPKLDVKAVVWNFSELYQFIVSNIYVWQRHCLLQ